MLNVLKTVKKILYQLSVYLSQSLKDVFRRKKPTNCNWYIDTERKCEWETAAELLHRRKSNIVHPIMECYFDFFFSNISSHARTPNTLYSHEMKSVLIRTINLTRTWIRLHTVSTGYEKWIEKLKKTKTIFTITIAKSSINKILNVMKHDNWMCVCVYTTERKSKSLFAYNVRACVLLVTVTDSVPT